MSMSDLLQGLADVLQDFFPDVNVKPFEPANPPVPSMFPLIPDGTYHVKFPSSTDGGAADLTVVVRVLVGAADQEAATANLLPYLDPTGERSVRRAIESDATLRGSCNDATVTGWTNGGGRFEYGSTPLLGADFNVSVMF